MLRRGLGPVALVAAVVVATWLITGVTVDQVIRYAGYEIAYVAAPGAALLWALRERRPGVLATIALGWPLGQTLEILAFSATAASGLRGLYLIYPVVVIAGSALVIWRRRQDADGGTDHQVLSARLLWATAAALSLGLMYLALAYVPGVPLPSATVPVAYHDPDFPYFIGLIAEVLHHWPATSPGLSGSPLHYEWFIFFHIAAVSQVTHISISVVALRLDYLTTMVVIGCELLAVSRYLARGAWTGVLAIVVVFLLGPLDLTTDASGLGPTPFVDLFSYHLWASWTFAYGLTFFLGLLFLISERLHAPTWRTRRDLGSWVAIALLMIGASGAKATVLPVIITGTGLYLVLVVVTRKQISAAAIVTLALGVVIFIATFLIVYGGGVPGTTIQPLFILGRTVPVTVVHAITSQGLRDVLLPFAYLAGLAGVLLPLTGMLYLLRRRHRGEITVLTFTLCAFAGGLLVATLVHQVSGSEEYFQDTGYVAGCIVAAAGLRVAWSDAGQALPISRRGIVISTAVWAGVLIAVFVVTRPTLAHPAQLVARYAGLAAGCLLFVVVWTFLRRARRRSTAGVLALGLIPLLAAAAVTTPIQLSPSLHRVLTGVPIRPTQADPQAVHGLTPGLLAALLWLQDHSSVDTVFAVNNHWVDPARTDGKYYYYTAFSERRVFVEAYDSIRYGITTGLATPAGVNFAYRQRLDDAVFNHADSVALSVMTGQYSVRFLFIDHVNGTADPAVPQLGRTVYSNQDATIVAVG
jgi:hypothetical protein